MRGVKRVVAGGLVVYAGLTATASAQECDRVQREVAQDGRPIPVYVSPGQFTEVVFPAGLAAILPEKPKGMDYFEPAFEDRLFFSVSDPLYHGIVIVQSVTGDTYHVKLLGRRGCADSTVKVRAEGLDAGDDGHGPRGDGLPPAPTAEERKRGKRLIDYMWVGETPSMYRREKVEGTPQERLVYEQGSVAFYMEEIWSGGNYTGFILLAVNSGRTPFRVALEKVNFQEGPLRETFGRVREVSMNPPDFRLGPAPEFSSDRLHGEHQGLIYIVSDKKSRVHGR